MYVLPNIKPSLTQLHYLVALQAHEIYFQGDLFQIAEDFNPAVEGIIVSL